MNPARRYLFLFILQTADYSLIQRDEVGFDLLIRE